MPRAGFRAGGEPFCAVNVKLTMRFPIAARLSSIRSLDLSRGILQVPGEMVTQVASNRFGHRAGRGGDVTRVPGAKGQQMREGFLRALPFSLASSPGRAPDVSFACSRPPANLWFGLMTDGNASRIAARK